MNLATTKRNLLEDSFVYSPIGVAFYDNGGKLLDVNRTICEKFTINDKSDFVITHLFNSDFLDEALKESLRQGNSVSVSSIFEVVIIPSMDIHRDVNGYVLFLLENKLTDETKIIDEALRRKVPQTQKMMELAMQHRKMASYVFDFNLFNTCDRIHCNLCFQFYGYANELLLRNKYICRSLTQLRHPDDRHDFFFLFKEVRDRKLDGDKITFRLKTDEGIYRIYEVTAKAEQHDAEGYPTRIVGTVIDCQDQMEYEASLIDAKENAENADRMKSTFLANMTHEIRSPLHAIVGFSELLGDENDEEVRKGYLNIIKANNDLLVRLVNDILDISKIEANMITLYYMNIDMPLFMKDIYYMINLRMPEEVELILDPCPQVVIETDKNRLSQILTNLLTNAIKHTQKGSIRFGYGLTDTEIKFYVTDTGQGIPEQKLEQVFSRFVQLKGAKQGVGLGLAICKGLVTKLGGDISVESKEGFGSTFRFHLPLYRNKETE